MMKRMVSALLIVGLLASFAAPAAAKKKKKGPKPYKSEEGTIAVGHPVFFSASGDVLSVTAQEFQNSCALPQSNGVDAYVYEIPADYQSIEASIQAFGGGSQVPHDLDIFLYDAECSMAGVFNSTNPDETGFVQKGTAYALLYNYAGDPVTVHIELKPLKK